MSEIEDFESAAAGTEDDQREAQPRSIPDALINEGPQGMFEEIERALPEKWREHIVDFPLTAITLAFGVGVFLGAKKGEELISAGSAMLSAAAAANLGDILGDIG